MASDSVFSQSDITRTIKRMAHEIVEGNPDSSLLVLLGIPTRGVVLANRLAEHIGDITGEDIPTGVLDVTMYRDDLDQAPLRVPQPTTAPTGGLDDRIVVLVDDVLFSGRTVRSALDALVDLGRPRAVRLAVLVDRGHRELPIRADYVGKNLPSALGERVQVRLLGVDDREAVEVIR
ncbi:Pyrimidine operon attenuation protein PyrR [Pontimonas salivibrio]|uniref:Bifunctional protein PyrR n=1 Tax=Pontimonas salivibrio TaxID=1159327 RepID=A0A2L2BQZ2_9MICO|nr:bifunctional pyr operon transcriptional regulator/uracil phosphoribosyltransferase PyrR [Pontimonas salivibrio]AVG24068.1 Pyrimidine operon attenuation protein PyrR [Pontimonas salivibrio]